MGVRGGETVKRRLRYRHGDTDTDLVPHSASNNRHGVTVALLRIAAVATCAAAIAGCSISLPMESLKTDGTATGSIDRTVALLSPSLDREDLRRAKAAMAVALDPQGNGARVDWRNPQTGTAGAFTAVGGPFTDHDRVCRRFSGAVLPTGAAERHLSGSACREGDGSWMVQALHDGDGKA